MIPGLGQPRALFGQVAPVTLTTLIALKGSPRRLDKSLVAAATAGWAAGGMLLEDAEGVAVALVLPVCVVAGLPGGVGELDVTEAIVEGGPASLGDPSGGGVPG